MRWGCPVFAWFCCSVIAATLLRCHSSAAEFPGLKSPNGQIEFKLASRQGDLSLDVSLAGRPVLLVTPFEVPEGGDARVVSAASDRLVLELEQPERAITPGQSGAVYRDDVLVGGGRIR